MKGHMPVNPGPPPDPAPEAVGVGAGDPNLAAGAQHSANLEDWLGLAPSTRGRHDAGRRKASGSPVQVARTYATLDYLTGGRAIVGIGAGHVEAEFDVLGDDHARRGDHLGHVAGHGRGQSLWPHDGISTNSAFGLALIRSRGGS